MEKKFPGPLKWLRDLGLQAKLTLMTILLSIVPLILLGTMAIQASQSVLKTISDRHGGTLLNEKKQFVRTVLEQVESLVANISGQDALKVILGRPFEAMSDFDRLSAQAGIGSILSGYINLKGLVSIDVIVPGGGTFHVGDTLDSNQLKDELLSDLSARSLESPAVVFWSGIEKNLNASSAYPRVITAVKRLVSRDNNPNKDSLLIVSFDPGVLGQGQDKTSEDFVMILDNRNRIVTAPDWDQWGQQAPTELLNALKSMEYQHNFSFNGKSYSLHTMNLEKGNWTMIHFTSLETLNRATNQITIGTLSFLALALLIVALLRRWISKQVVWPIRRITLSFAALQVDENQEPTRLEFESQDEIGALILWYNTFLDAYLSKRKTEEALKELNRTLEHRVESEVAANREKDSMLIQQSRQASMGEMIGNIAHQWRQPLNTAALLVQDMSMSFEDGTLDAGGVRDFTDRMMAVIEKMSTTIDDFRDFFKPNKEKVRFSVEASVLTCISFVESAFKNHDIEIWIEKGNPGTLLGYPNEFSQVIINILNNARDILVEKKVPGKIVRVWMGTQEGKQVVTIADSGGGVPEAILPKIFDPYFTTKGPGEGTGIGLFMSRTIIERNMGGRLTVQNREFAPGLMGAEFTITVE